MGWLKKKIIESMEPTEEDFRRLDVFMKGKSVALAHPSPEVTKLVESLGINPTGVHAVTIRVAAGDAVTITTEKFATGEQVEKLAGEVEKYVLVPKAEVADGR